MKSLKTTLNNNLIILAGGFGTRLQSVSNGIPKALMPIGDSVYLDLLLEKVFDYDIAHVYLSLHYKSELFQDYVNNSSYKNKLTCIIEPEPLGTGGAINYLIQNTTISDPVFVLNGDTLSNTDLDLMMVAFKQSDYNAMIGISHVVGSSRYGMAKFEGDRLVEFNEKVAAAGWINNGHYILKKNLFKNHSGKFSIEYDMFKKLTGEKRLGVFPVENDDFVDMGIPDDYKKLCNNYMEKN